MSPQMWPPWKFWTTKAQKKEMLERLGAPACEECQILRARLHKYEHPGKLHKIFFETIGDSYSFLRLGWVLLIFALGISGFLGLIFIIVHPITQEQQIENQRICRQTCALIGGNKSVIMDGVCYCRTPHIAPGFMQIK